MSHHNFGPKRHHTVPRFYLRRFADERDRLVRIPLGTDTTSHVVKVTNVAVESYFYQAELSDGSLTNQLEEILSHYESKWSPAIDAFVRGDRSKRMRGSLASWIAMQFLRTTWNRELIKVAAEHVGELMDRHGGRPAGWAWHPNVHLAGMFNAHRQIVDILVGRAWSTIAFERKALITSDNPVVLLPRADADEFTPLSIASNDGIYVPLDRRMGLLLTEHAVGLEFVGTAAKARDYNQLTAWNAHRALFHHPDDQATMDKIELPPPREPDIGVQTFSLDSLAEYLRKRDSTPQS